MLQRTPYEKRNETGLVFFITPEDFVSFHLDNVSHYGLAPKDGEGIDFDEQATIS